MKFDAIYPTLAEIVRLRTANLPWNNVLDNPCSPGKVPCWLCVDCVKKNSWLKMVFFWGGNLNNPLKNPCISRNLWLILLWPACGTVTGFCSRFLLEAAQCPSIDWEAAAGQSVAVCPGAEGCFCVCVFVQVCVCPFALSITHRTSIVMSLALCSNIWLGASASSPRLALSLGS